MAARATRNKIVEIALVLPSVVEALEREMALNAAALTRAGVPRAQHGEVLSRLEAGGFERTKSGVRVPLRRQLLSALEERKTVPLAQLGKLVRGAPQKEAKAAAAALVSDGAAKTVLRGKIESIAAVTVPVLSNDQVVSLARICKQLASLAAKAAKRGNATLLHEDVREQLLDFVTASRPQRQAISLVDATISELGKHVRSSVGLSYVPDAVRALSAYGLPEVHAALLEAARSGRIELQPDSGLDRLTQEEMELCPPGPHGTRLSWARLPGEIP